MGRVEKYLGLKFGARDYDPQLQVWMEPDPAQYVDGMDRYQFVGSNPIAMVDPSGLDDGGGENTGPTTESAHKYHRSGGTQVGSLSEPVGDLGDVTVWTDAHLSPDGQPRLTLDSKEMWFSFNAKKACDCHWIQFIKALATKDGQRWTGEFPLYNNDNSVRWEQFGNDYNLEVDTSVKSPWADKTGTIIVPHGSDAETFDSPLLGAPADKFTAVLIDVETLLVCSGKIRYHASWDREWTSSKGWQYGQFKLDSNDTPYYMKDKNLFAGWGDSKKQHPIYYPNPLH